VDAGCRGARAAAPCHRGGPASWVAGAPRVATWPVFERLAGAARGIAGRRVVRFAGGRLSDKLAHDLFAAGKEKKPDGRAGEQAAAAGRGASRVLVHHGQLGAAAVQTERSRSGGDAGLAGRRCTQWRRRRHRLPWRRRRRSRTREGFA